MNILIDMNLAPGWVATFESRGWQAVHWSAIGRPDATDRVIMEWARANGYVVFTHDLDFGTLLALTHAGGPSVVQVRAQNVMPEHLQELVASIMSQYQVQLHAGALVTVDEARSRVRILPL